MTYKIERVAVAAAALVAVAAPSYADYDSHPELKPENRCFDAAGNSLVGTLHCQRLFWDLPVSAARGTIKVSAPFAQDPIPQFPHGDVDRIPPLFVADEDGDGAPEGFEKQNAEGTRERLCENPLEVPWWKPILDADNQPVIGAAGGTVSGSADGEYDGMPILGHTADGEVYGAVDDPGTPGVDEGENGTQTGALFVVDCRLGTRSYFGPWQTAGTENDYDRLTKNQLLRVETTDLLDWAESEGRLADRNGDGILDRVTWATGSAFYNHFGSHHATCWLPNPSSGEDVAACNDVNNPQPREAYQDGGYCRDYQEPADTGGSCASDDADVDSCKNGVGNGGFQNATQVPGRLYIEVPDQRGILGVEDQLLTCNHHTVTQLPPGSYAMTELANFRLVARGLKNNTDKAIYGRAPGEYIGGTVGELIMQAFGEPYLNEAGEVAVKPANTAFIAATDAATTYYPPFTWNYHTALWFAPFDANIGLTTIHSHHRMVKGTMNILPANTPRPNSPNEFCGGAGASDIYLNWEWEDARVCEYWKDPDGPVVIRKGEPLAVTCFVNNGITPEAIKHGLVAGSVVENLRNMGAPIPDYPEMVPASTWGDALAESPVGDQVLYGTHPPVNYRVVYKCAPQGLGSSMFNVPTYRNNPPCNANPAVDADGDYIDGPYRNPGQCGTDSNGEPAWCEPSSIIFACVGEDEMCLGVALYWSLDRLGDMESGGHDRAVGHASEGDVNKVGTPGSLGVPGDAVAGGACPECEGRPDF